MVATVVRVAQPLAAPFTQLLGVSQWRIFRSFRITGLLQRLVEMVAVVDRVAVPVVSVGLVAMGEWPSVVPFGRVVISPLETQLMQF
jgi:hypothetical protein